MKKIIFIVVAAMFALTTAAQAQNYKSWKAPKDEPDLLRASALAYVGYNFLENAPMGGVALGLNCYCVRAELDFGFSSLKTPTLEKKRHSWGTSVRQSVCRSGTSTSSTAWSDSPPGGISRQRK